MPGLARLKGRMVEYGVSAETLAKALNINISTVYRKLKDLNSFTVGEVRIMIDLLHLTVGDVEYIFNNQSH